SPSIRGRPRAGHRPRMGDRAARVLLGPRPSRRSDQLLPRGAVSWRGQARSGSVRRTVALRLDGAAVLALATATARRRAARGARTWLRGDAVPAGLPPRVRRPVRRRAILRSDSRALRRA